MRLFTDVYQSLAEHIVNRRVYFLDEVKVIDRVGCAMFNAGHGRVGSATGISCK